ncbi:hypothetical protein [Rhodococcus sp. ACT016]|uniref:hypothetical protein n=1 Tax=Rhodococcus sp. ACT016 TaxID=3134808 RepID=UPI003D297605
MQPGTRTESEAEKQEPVARDAVGPPAGHSTRDDPAPEAQYDYLLGSPSAGRVVAIMLVVGIAGAVGFAMASIVAMLVTGAVGAVTAYLVAHDDDWLQATRTRPTRARRRHVAVSPSWSGSWSGEAWGDQGVGRRAA